MDETALRRPPRPRRSTGTSMASGTSWPPGARVADGRTVADPERTHRRGEPGAPLAMGGPRPVQWAPRGRVALRAWLGRHEVRAGRHLRCGEGVAIARTHPARADPSRVGRRRGVQRQRHAADDPERLHGRRRRDHGTVRRRDHHRTGRRALVQGADRGCSRACGGRPQRHERDREEPRRDRGAPRVWRPR